MVSTSVGCCGSSGGVDSVAEEAAEIGPERHRVSAGHGSDVVVMLGQALGRIARANERRNGAQAHHPSPLAHARQHVIGKVARIREHGAALACDASTGPP